MQKGKLVVVALLALSTVFTNVNAINETGIKTAISEDLKTQLASNLTLRSTEFGIVKGSVDTKHDTLFWKGVPYAKAPVGELRWKKPADLDKWTGVLDTTQSANFALQLNGNEIVGVEDSLNMDIYRPNNKTENLPVLVYIHGGNNQTGKSEEIKGNAIVNDIDAVFISINYRLGPLGFNPLPALNTGNNEEDSGNYTLLDIAKALDWIKGNIHSFGGDPDNITISGFSAGGRDVMAMLISPLFDGKFQQAISFSGGMTIADKGASEKVFAKAIAPLVVEDKVKANEDDAYKWLLTKDPNVKTYLYSIKSERLVSLMTNAGIRMSVFPHLYNDGYVLPKEGFNTVNYNSVPLIMLTGTGEFSLFAKWSPYFQSYFDDNGRIKENIKEFEFASQYGGKLYDLFNVIDSAEKMAPFYKANIYGMEIKFGENSDIVGDDMALFGAFHGVFVPLFDSDSQNYIEFTGEDAYSSKGAHELSTIFKKYIYNFIRTGTPNSNELVEWRNWSAQNNDEGKSLLYMDADKNKAIISMGGKMFTYQDVLNEMDKDHTISQHVKEEIISEVLNGRWFSTELDKKYGNKSLWVK